MSYETKPDASILIAVPDEWRDELFDHLTQRGYRLLIASTREEALKIILSESIGGLIVVSEWGLSREDGKAPGLIEYVQGKVPSVSIIRDREGYNRLDELYINPFHQYCSIPFAIEELIAWMNKANMMPGRMKSGEE